MDLLLRWSRHSGTAFKDVPSAQTTETLYTTYCVDKFHTVILVGHLIRPSSVLSMSTVRQKACHSTPKTVVHRHICTSKISDKWRRAIWFRYGARWCGCSRWVRKQSKGVVMSVNMIIQPIYQVSTRWMYAGVWWNKAFCWQNIRPGSLSMVMDWHSVQFYVHINAIGRIYEGNIQATSTS